MDAIKIQELTRALQSLKDIDVVSIAFFYSNVNSQGVRIRRDFPLGPNTDFGSGDDQDRSRYKISNNFRDEFNTAVNPVIEKYRKIIEENIKTEINN